MTLLQLDQMFVNLIVKRSAIPADCIALWAIDSVNDRARSVSNDLIRMSFMGGQGYDSVVKQMTASGLVEFDKDGKSQDFVDIPHSGEVPQYCGWLETGRFSLLDENTVGISRGHKSREIYAWLKGSLATSLPVPNHALQTEVLCRVVPGGIDLTRGDITRMGVDAMVNAANCTLLGGGGVDGAIHRAAGPRLREECKNLGGCKVAEVKVTHAYDLPARWVLHTVGPFWSQHDQDEEGMLAACYRNVLVEATRLGARSVAFPCISTGVYNYPSEDAAEIAVDVVRRYLCETGASIRVIFCCYSNLDYAHYASLLGEETGVCNEISGFVADHKARIEAREKKRRLRSVVKGQRPPENGDWSLEPM
jgi:O-acetyl-ADP-ribose deacetylase (regulator of RNase III)